MRKLIGSALLAVAACSHSPGTRAEGSNAPAAPAVDLSRCDPSGKRVSTLDTNGDGKMDVWKIYTTVLTCKEIDLNHDGRVDAFVYYDDAGERSLERFDLDFDGRFDQAVYYEGGKRVRTEVDTNFDQKPDIWKFYEANRLVRVERDANHDGKIDYWEYYEAGKLDRIGYDTTGSGKVDKWDRAPEETEGPEATASAAGTVPQPTPPAGEATTPQPAAEETSPKGTPGLAPGQTPPKRDKKK